MSHVFISYKHDDLDFAEIVQSRLEKASIKTWKDDHIRYGDEWRNQIDQAIKDAFAMIVIMTPEAKASEYVTYEWAFAVGIGVRVIPVKFTATPLHPRLEAIQHLDFTNKSGRQWERLIKEVQEAEKSAQSVPSMAITASTLSFIEQAKAALNGTEAHVRQNAIATLAQANSSEAHEVLLEALSHPVADVRQQAAAAMNGIQYQAAIPKLVELLHDPAQNVRIAAINALRSVSDDKSISGLLAALTQSSEKTQIVWALYGVKDDSVVSALLAQYEDKDTDRWLRSAIIATLGSLNSTQAIPTLKNALRDPEQCINAFSALLEVGSEEAIDLIADALLSYDKSQCLDILEKILTTKFGLYLRIGRLMHHLDDLYHKHLPHSSGIAAREKLAKVRRRIIWIFGILKNDRAIPTLITSMDDKDLVVQQETVIAFKEIKDERSLPALMTILRWRFECYDEVILLHAIQALSYVGNASVIPQLKAVLGEMLKKPFIELAIQVLNVFGEFGNYETIEYLRNVKTNIKQKIAASETEQELVDAVDDAIDAIRSRLY